MAKGKKKFKRQIIQMLIDLIPELTRITIEHMIQSGVPRNSRLIDSVEYKLSGTRLNLIANDYWFFVSKGRRAGVRKVPVDALIDWIKRYGIVPRGGMTINQLAFAIQNSIYKQGINPKNYIEKIIDSASDLSNDILTLNIADMIADDIVDTLKS